MIAASTMAAMLRDVDASIVQRIVELGGEVAVIGKDQVTTDIPAYSHLRGVECGNGGGTYDEGTRGLGGHLANPLTSGEAPAMRVAALGSAVLCARALTRGVRLVCCPLPACTQWARRI